MKKRHTVNLDAIAAARLDAIRRHIAGTSGYSPPKVRVVSRALQLMCEAGGIPDPAKTQVPDDE